MALGHLLLKCPLNDAWVFFLRIADDAGLVDVFAGEAEVSGAGRSFPTGTTSLIIAGDSNFFALLRSVVFVGEAKMRDHHEVPLSRQALAILGELRPLTGQGRYLFSHDDEVPMSDNTINKALRIMGYDTRPGGDHCAHGFRSTASTLLNEEGEFDGDVVEAQLAHETDEKKRRRRDEVVRRQLANGDKNKIRGIYNCAVYWRERVRLMQHWADRLDHLRESVVVPLRKSA